MKIKPIFAWYDFWIGIFWDSKKRRLYILPIPCVGVVFELLDKKTALEPSANKQLKEAA